jgi:hypothetical protein
LRLGWFGKQQREREREKARRAVEQPLFISRENPFQILSTKASVYEEREEPVF